MVYTSQTKFEIGKAQVVRQTPNDKIVFIGAGVTLHECLKAADLLEKELNLNARVIDPFTIKPLDVQTIVDNVAAVGGRVLVVEDHYPEGERFVNCPSFCLLIFNFQFPFTLQVVSVKPYPKLYYCHR